jgi:subtilisin family serine protease
VLASNAHRLLAGLLVAATLVPLPTLAAPQVVLRGESSPGVPVVEVLPPGHGVVRTFARGRLVRSQAIDPAAPVRILVAFDSAPAVVARARGQGVGVAGDRVEQLRSDLARLGGAGATTEGAAPTARITHAYTQVFSGAAVTLPPDWVDAVRRLPYVRSVAPDDTVRAHLAESVPLIGADRVKNELGATGSGIRVGILDSGIDFDHPAFGGFGPGHRVAGGWDFANGDADPRDDFGHGTHVAGIVAGHGGGVTGVAPGATLYAYKVLDANGFGWESWILAAFERVLDPDQDPATDDALHVINLSLGGDGDADDPLSTAVDHLAEAGVVCVVSAGNDYGHFRIGSPGTARRALTVGASSKSGAIAAFSSRGPVSGTLDLKPDLVAPGVDIVSAARGGGVLALSGTSMAAPHVAGVAAQLRQLHPSWSAAAVQAALIGSARDLSDSPFVQGAGRLDAWDAAQAGFTVSPSHLSFARIDGDVPTWTGRDTLQVTNRTAGPLTVTFPASIPAGPGATLAVRPTTVLLPGGATVPVVAELTVVNGALPYPDEMPFGHAATLAAGSGSSFVRIPFSFHKAASLRVHSPTGNLDWWTAIHPASGRLHGDFRGRSVLLPPGRYDLFTTFWPFFRFVFREGVNVSGDVDLAVEPDQADLVLRFVDLGPDGAPVTCNAGMLSLRHESGVFRTEYAGFPIPEIRSSSMGPAWHMEWNRLATDLRTRQLSFPGGRAGLTQSQTFTNDPSAFRHVAVHLPAPAVVPAGLVVVDWGPSIFGGDGFGGWGFYDPEQPPVTGPITFDHWITPSPREHHQQVGYAFDLYPRDGIGQLDFSRRLQIGPYLRVDRGWPFEVAFPIFGADPPWSSFGGEDLGVFQGLPVWRGRFTNDDRLLVLDAGPELGAPHLVTDMYGTMALEDDPPFTLLRGGAPIVDGLLTGAGTLSLHPPIVRELPAADAYEFRTERSYTVRGRPATLDVRATFDTRRGDRDPPSLRMLQLFADGAAVDSIPGTAADAGLRFRMTDAGAFATPSLWMRPGPAGDWIPLAVADEGGGSFVAALPPVLASPVALRLSAVDASGNRMTLTWDPAFVTPPGPRFPGLPPGAGGFALRGAWPNPTSAGNLAVQFSLASSAPARLTLHDVAGRALATREVGALGPGPHALAWTELAGMRPGIYFLRLAQAGLSSVKKVCLVGR